MTQLLISVTSIQEAQLALENGVDIIDLKDPSAGALGALPLQQIQSIVTYIDAKKPVSATIGDVPMQPDLLLGQVNALAATQVDFIKIGFFEADDYQACLDLLQHAAKTNARFIAVLFAEYKYPVTLIAAIKQAGFCGVMLDTAKKNGTTFLDHYSEGQYKQLAEQIFSYEMSFGIAGSLRLEHIACVNKVQPSYIGFRGGVCVDYHRRSGLDVAKIQAIREML
jgi:uncharacterized protein (UPF0264 family)